MRYPKLETKLRKNFSFAAINILTLNYPKYCALLEKDLNKGTLINAIEEILYEEMEALEWKLAEDRR